MSFNLYAKNLISSPLSPLERTGETINVQTTLTEDSCHFSRCSFVRATFERHFVFTDNANINDLLTTCLFFQINTLAFMIEISYTTEWIQDKCCLFEKTLIMFTAPSVFLPSQWTGLLPTPTLSILISLVTEISSVTSNHTYFKLALGAVKRSVQ